jgi:hypothetical protein
MTLGEQQRDFMRALGILLPFIYSKGYEVTPGDMYPSKFKHRRNSWHEKGLAIDLNLFKDGKYLTKTRDHKFAGKFWESIGGTWGGLWQDGNHYSWNESKRKYFKKEI